MRRLSQLAKKSDLVTSAARIVTSRGLAGSTLGEIADGAGMSANAALYYYPSLKALLEDVQRQAIERFCEGRAAAISGIADPITRLAVLMENGLPDGSDDQLCRLLYELGSHARTDAAYAARHIGLFGRQVALYTGVLEAGAALGLFRLAGSSMTLASTLVVLEDGLGLHLINKTPSFDHATALRLLFGHASIATGVEASVFEAASKNEE